MNIRSTFLIGLVFFFIKSSAQTAACVDSSTVFLLKAGSDKIDIRQSIVLVDSGVLVYGNIWQGSQSDSSLFIARLDKFNNIVFSKKITGYKSFARKIIQCNNGDILLTANQYSSDQVQAPHLFRINLTGNILWQKKIPLSMYHSMISDADPSIEISENDNNDIFIGISANFHTNNPGQDAVSSGNYIACKVDFNGNPIWRTVVIQNGSFSDYISAVREVNGEVLVVTQQRNIDNNIYCNSSNKKSIGLIKFNEGDGALISSKSYCLNFADNECPSVDDSKNSVQILNNGDILIGGRSFVCGLNYLFTIKLDNSFLNPQCYIYNYMVSYSTLAGSIYATIFDEVIVFSRGYNYRNFLYAILLPNGNGRVQRKMELPSDVMLSTGSFSPAFKSPDNFIFFSNQTENGQDFIRVMEVKGNNNETADCTGKDTTFIASQPHNIVPITFVWDTIRTEVPATYNSNYTLSDFSFQRQEVCSSVSICDSLKIIGPDTVCLNSPQQLFSVYRNPECHKIPKWKIDPDAIQSIQEVNDTTVSIAFKQAWEGYLYAYNSSCESLSDSLYIKVVANPAAIQLGGDTSFCSPVVLDAGTGFLNYSWQDGSANRQFTVTTEGTYYVTASDFCGNEYSDTIKFSQKKGSVFIGNDTCVQFPHVISASTGYKTYEWQDGSANPQFTVNVPGLYFVNVTNGCNENFADSVVINKQVDPFSLGADMILCSGNQLNMQVPAGFANYQWQDGSVTNSFIATEPGLYHVSISDACGNSYSDSININPLLLSFSAGRDTIICNRDKIKLSASANFINYSWTPNYKISSTSGQAVWVEPAISTNYIVSAETNTGCIVSDTISIEVKDCPQYLYFPSAFTPNSDGKNDLFRPSVSGVPEQYEFIIYNRWGQAVFKTTDYRKGWDGTFNGKPQGNDIFVWMCRYKFYNLPVEAKKGTVLVIR